MDPTRKSAPGLGSVSRRVGADIRQLTQEARLQTEGQAPPPRTCAGPWDRINVGSAWLRPLPHALLQTPPLASGKRTDTQEQAPGLGVRARIALPASCAPPLSS